MPETEPLYFKEFRIHIDKKFGEVDKKFEGVDRKFEGVNNKIDDKIAGVNGNIDSLAASTVNQFNEMDLRFDRLDNEIGGIKESMEKIEAHIGRYEIRAQNIEEILLKDYKPRLKALEKTVFA